MKTRSTRNKLSDSDDDMEDVPLKYISSRHKKYCCIKDLKKFSLHACEFCEKKFENSYDHLIHNSTHIIIPLIKMQPHYCAECGLYYISEKEMNDHMSDKHKNINKLKGDNNGNIKMKVSDRIKFETDNMIVELNEYELLNSLIKEEEENTDFNNDTLENFVINCEVDEEKFNPPWLYQSNEGDVKSQTNIYGIDINNHEEDFITSISQSVTNRDKDVKVDFNNCTAEFKTSEQMNSIDRYECDIKNHIEEFKPLLDNHVINSDFNIAESKPLKEQHNVINENIDYFKITVDNYGSSECSDLVDDPIVVLAPIKQELMTDCDSVHFDDLMNPGIFQCKRCYKRFPNRYGLIIHETVHLDMSKASLKGITAKHRIKDHTSHTIRPPHVEPVTTCTRSQERYQNQNVIGTNRNSNEQTYSRQYCNDCGQGFQNGTDLKTHKASCGGEVVVNLCENCLYIRKKPTHVQYIGLTKLSRQAVKLQCHWCGRMCEELSRVTMKTRPRREVEKKLADRIEFEGGRSVKSKPSNYTRGRVKELRSRAIKRSPARVSKPLSNRDRLQSIQARLKSMKK